MDLAALGGGELLVASADPWLGRLKETGEVRWEHSSPNADFRADRASTLAVSRDGRTVDFGLVYGGTESARFDLITRSLTLNPPPDDRTERPGQSRIPVVDWEDNPAPTLAGQALPLKLSETSRSFAVHPSGDRFVLGADWTLRAFQADGTLLWERPTPSTTWAVNITGDGQLVVAAYGDGTIRWHRMSDGVELLAFMPLAPASRGDWVAWTPEGIYAASPGAHGVLRWHVNHGWDQAADSVPVEAIPGTRRPDVLPLVLQELETPRALGLAGLAEIRQQVVLKTQSQVPPGAKLHLLAIGIDAYDKDYANTLHLNYADKDASDLASAIVNTQGSLYAQVLAQVLLNKDADRQGIKRALETVLAGMARGTGHDLAVIHFSGHGAKVGDRLYLLPADVDPTPFGIEDGAISVDYLRDKLAEIAKYGRVLVLIDACHSGAFEMNGTALRAGLAGANVTVLTSSSGDEVSWEKPDWQHGAFTKVLLDALNDPAADPDRTGLITANGLAHYVAQRVPTLTDGAQRPDMEVRYEGTVFETAQ